MQEERKWCPLIQKKCVQHKCAFYTHIQGVNPNTGETVNKFDCAVNWVPFLLMEAAQKTEHTAAAVESFRNEMVDAQEKNQQLYIDSLNHTIENGLLPVNIHPIDTPMTPNVLDTTVKKLLDETKDYDKGG